MRNCRIGSDHETKILLRSLLRADLPCSFSLYLESLDEGAMIALSSRTDPMANGSNPPSAKISHRARRAASSL